MGYIWLLHFIAHKGISVFVCSVANPKQWLNIAAPRSNPWINTIFNSCTQHIWACSEGNKKKTIINCRRNYWMLSFSNCSPCSMLLPRLTDIDFPSRFQACAYGPAALQKSLVLFCAPKSGSKAHRGQWSLCRGWRTHCDCKLELEQDTGGEIVGKSDGIMQERKAGPRTSATSAPVIIAL